MNGEGWGREAYIQFLILVALERSHKIFCNSLTDTKRSRKIIIVNSFTQELNIPVFFFPNSFPLLFHKMLSYTESKEIYEFFHPFYSLFCLLWVQDFIQHPLICIHASPSLSKPGHFIGGMRDFKLFPLKFCFTFKIKGSLTIICRNFAYSMYF